MNVWSNVLGECIEIALSKVVKDCGDLEAIWILSIGWTGLT
jgi:hypothetical protein